jgi:hypothetical protein
VPVGSVVIRIAATCSALSWLVFPGFGLIDLAVTWNAAWPVVLEAGWGLFATMIVGAAFVAVAAVPRQCAAPLSQLWLAAATLAVAAFAGSERPAWRLVALLVVETAVVTALVHRLSRGRPVARATVAASYPLLALAVAGAAPWLVYAVRMFRADRSAVPVDVSVGVDHYAVQGALAISLVASTLVAALWPRGRRHLGISAGLAATYLGLV